MMETNPDALDRELDEALEMTFPASDPVAAAAPGSQSQTGTPPKGDEPADRADKTRAAKPAAARSGGRRKR